MHVSMASRGVEHLEEDLKQIESEYEAGELTLKGYRKRSLLLRKDILEAELEEGIAICIAYLRY